MYRRDLENTIYRLSSKFQVVGIIGPRQSGKTTLAKVCFPLLPYVSFENFDIKNFALNDPRSFLANYKNGGIFDEVQHVPHLLSYLQQMVDEDDTPGKFVLTGSQNFVLSNQISQSLAGRIGLVTLLPLSYRELNVAMEWEEAVLKGGYPRLHKYTIAPSDYYAAYLHTYIEQDVRQMQNIQNLASFKNFLLLCAGRSGQLLNTAKLAEDAGISHSTAERWLSVLQASFIIFLIPPYHSNFNKRLAKQPKLYFYDTGLLCSLLSIETKEQLKTHYHHGALFENFIFTEILKYRLNKGKSSSLYFWKDRVTHAEVDLIAEWGGIVHALEIKAGRTFHTDWLKGVFYLHNVQPKTNMYLLYNGDFEQSYKECQVISFKSLSRLFNLLETAEVSSTTE